MLRYPGLTRLRRGALPTLAVVVWLTATPVARGSLAPILAGPWGPDQRGYGQARPTTIYNGGDPAGLVRSIHWSSWGGKLAIGSGIGLYIGPTQHVYQGTQEPVRIVLFQRGRCHGRYAYDAIEWYFPQHGQRFEPDQYINACTGKYFVKPDSG